MAKCQFCDKGLTFGIQVSHSHRRTNRTWKPNVKRVKAIIDGSPRHVYVCTRCLRSGKVTRAVYHMEQTQVLMPSGMRTFPVSELFSRSAFPRGGFYFGYIRLHSLFFARVGILPRRQALDLLKSP